MTTFAPTAADITFNESDHSYWAGLVQVPSVSEILRPLTDDYLRGIPEAILNRKRDVGLAVHRACELIDTGYEIDPDTLDDDVAGYVEGYRKFLVDMRPSWTSIEQIVFDERRWYAGRLDRAGVVNGDMLVIDIKTGVTLGPAVAIQLTAYAEAAPEGPDVTLAALQLLPEGNYRLVKQSYLPAVWDALLTLHHYKEKNR